MVAPGASQPPSRAEARARSPKAHAVWRIEEDEREGLAAIIPQSRRIAAEDLGHALRGAAADIVAQKRTRRAAIVDEGRMNRAPRQRLQPQRAGAREKVQHPRAGHQIAEAAIGQQVEQAFAHPVRGGPQMGRGIALAQIGEGLAPPAPGHDPQWALMRAAAP
jgi:hypothetical protein